MIELLRTNDIVLISVVESLFDAEGIGYFVADSHVAAIEGAIGAFQRRVMVLDEDAPRARRVVAAAGLAHELRDAR